MKTIVCTLLGLLMALSINAQTYLPDEFIVQYVTDVTDAEKQAVRDIYEITDYTEIDELTDHWYNISFPIDFTENGETDVISSIEELLLHINIQENEGETARTDVQEQDFNYILELNLEELVYDDDTYDPLPFCTNFANTALIGPALASDGSEQESIPHIVIIDQVVPAKIASDNGIVLSAPPARNFNDLLEGEGRHASAIYSIINNQLEAANVEATYSNMVVFNGEGVGYYADLLWAISNMPPNSIVNFSANMVVSPLEEELALVRQWGGQIALNNVLFISAAGNQGLDNMDYVLPAAGNFANEITVGGTQNCGQQPLSYGNADPNYVDILTEGDNILAEIGEDFKLVSGTSYSTAFVTGVVAQLAARCKNFDASLLKQQIVDSAVPRANLDHIAHEGRLMYATQAINTMDYNASGCNNDTQGRPSDGFSGGIKTLENYQIKSIPNPFQDKSIIHISVDQTAPVQLVLYNLMGQTVSNTYRSTAEQGDVIQWETPVDLVSGVYMLRVQIGKEVYQETLVKQ